MLFIFTDLDGTLLNQNDYRYDDALPILEILKNKNIPVIPVTSKTKAEVESLCAEIGLNDPFITENGSGIFIPKDDFRFDTTQALTTESYNYISLGFEYHNARCILWEISQKLKTDLVGFGDLSPEDIVNLTGLSLNEAILAKTRNFTEPFLTPKHINPSLLQNIAQEYQATIVVGDRFSHLVSAKAGKGNAVKWLLNNYHNLEEKITTIGLGNSPNDISLLESVDIPIIIPNPDGVHKGLKNKNWQVAPHSGSKGWSQVITEIILSHKI
ncbi:HAD-IIB family hydrolase [Cyanobacterium aponinum]|uniref:HAD-IIB family hydrolase n=1 Tax=Cyanobacterium aponinum 0216 TaxID=2676140 RepID=A0A844GVN7_9CHRO|nr:HAD-IIB family hydrolase [Cyanobacterium aponinum]MTF40544.1 HAD-IIB family hydrolase [Cyanobacterium aponinum 0216]